MVPTTVESTNFLVAAFQGGGFGMIPIAIVMVFVIFIIFERYVTLSRLAVDKKDFNDKLFGFILRGDIRQAITFCDSKPAPLTNTLKAGLVQVLNKRPDEEVQVAMDGAALKEVPVLDGWTGFLAVFGNVATLLGLLGTIIGLIHSFRAVTNADPAQKATLLSGGIAEAMNCTAFGLIVAIPSLLAYGYYQTRTQRLVNDMNESSMNLMNLIVANRDKIKD
jgi:biopolymer transport protein ExbB/TolQ